MNHLEGSIGFWIKLNDGLNREIIVKSKNKTKSKYFSYEYSSLIFSVNNGSEIKINSSLDVGTWYYIVGTWDDVNNQIKLYINGSLVDSSYYY